MVQQDDHVGQIDLAVPVDIACDDRLTERRAEVRLARLGRPAVGAYIDHAAIGEGLVPDRTVWIARIDAGAGDLVPDPTLTGLIPPPRLGLQMAVPLNEEVVVRIVRRPIGVPLSGIDKERIGLDIALSKYKPIARLSRESSLYPNTGICNLHGRGIAPNLIVSVG